MVGLRPAFYEGTLLRSAPEQGVSRPPHTASRDCRNGSPLVRAIPCAPAVSIHGFFTRCRRKRVAGLRRLRAEVVARPPASSGESPHAHTKTEKKTPRISACAPTRSVASRDGMAGWAGEGGGRFGERREYEAPTLPSTPRQHGMARHHNSQARNKTPRQHGAACHHNGQPRNNNENRQNRQATQKPAEKRQLIRPGQLSMQIAATRQPAHAP